MYVNIDKKLFKTMSCSFTGGCSIIVLKREVLEMSHCVYCLVFEETGLLKIGYSGSVRSRYYQLKAPFGPASEQSLLLICEENLAKSIEKKILSEFADKRLPSSRVRARARGNAINSSSTEFFDVNYKRIIEDYFLKERLANSSIELSSLGATTVREIEDLAELIDEAKTIFKQYAEQFSKFRRLLNASRFFK